MDLRTKIALWVSLLAASIGGLGVVLLGWHLQHSYLALEHSAARDDFARLLRGIDFEVAVRDRVLREWSQWNDLYSYMHTRDARFAQANLTPIAIQNSRLAWLGLYDPHAGRIASVQAPAQHTVAPGQFSAQVQAWLATAPQGAAASCGFALAQGALFIVCRRPVQDETAALAPRGHIAVAEWVQPATLEDDVSARAGLPAATLRLDPAAAAAQMRQPAVAQDWQDNALTLLGWPGPLRVQVLGDRMDMQWVVRDVAGAPIATLTTPWPRRILAQGRSSMAQMLGLVAGMVLALTLGLLFVADREIIARLVRLRGELARIHHGRDWAARVHQRGHDEVGALAADTNRLLQVIEDQVRELEHLSRSDRLTGLGNRRAFDERINAALRLQRRSGQPLVLLLIDVDHFKRYNDHYGHPQGDIALQSVGRLLAESVRRPGDFAARVGGEEFAVLLQGTPLEGAHHWAQQLVQALKDAAIAHAAQGEGALLTLSIGLAAACADDTAQALYRRADVALYLAKTQGRNQVVAGNGLPLAE